MAKTIVFRLSKPFQELIVNYLHERRISLAKLIELSIERLCKNYEKYLNNQEDEGKEFWKRGSPNIRLGTKIEGKNLAKLRKISELTGRSVSDLIKEGIWKIIKEEEEVSKDAN
jgi:predicted DNA-binding protein